MYAVTERYKKAPAAQIRGPCKVKLDICRLDGKAQAGAVADMSAGCLSDCQPEKTTDLTVFPRRVASFEPDWLRVDGSQMFLEDEPPYFISQALSGGQIESTDSGDAYPITLQSISVSFPADLPSGQRVTWQFDPECWPTSVSVYKDNVLQGSYTVDGEWLTVSLIGKLAAGKKLKATVRYVNRPNARLRVYKVYAGDVKAYTGSNLISLKHTDINDGIGLEMPERKLSVSLRNTEGLNTQAEYLSPTYQATDTQAVLQIGMDVDGAPEWVPMGRYFLQDYQVDEDSVDFNFVDAVGLLSQYTHWYAAFTEKYEPRLIMDGYQDVLREDQDTPVNDYGIRCDYTQASNQTQKVFANVPLVSAADALRLYASVGGNMVRGCRTGMDLEIVPSNSSAERLIVRYELLKQYQWKVGDVISSFEIEDNKPLTKRITVSKYEEVEEGDFAAGQYYTVQQDKPINGLYIQRNGTWQKVNDVYVDRLAYQAKWHCNADYSGKLAVGNCSSPVTRKVIYTPAGAAKNGDSISLVNPIASTFTPSGVENYASLVYNELRYPLTTDLSHRGFPELDAGDLIRMEDGGQEVQVRVLENTVEIKAGAMSGTTKVRRMQ